MHKPNLRLKFERERRGWSQSRVAEEIDVSPKMKAGATEDNCGALATVDHSPRARWNFGRSKCVGSVSGQFGLFGGTLSASGRSLVIVCVFSYFMRLAPTSVESE